MTDTFSGEIKVASRIIDHLSSGLYHSPAACLKELVNNSYDADATIVNLFVKPDADRIIIEDNGLGLSRTDFVSHFDRVSESHKRDFTAVTPSGRAPIGKIGIGFIAANEICDVMELYSTKAGSTELLHVSIDFARMREPVAQRRRKDVDIAKADYSGEILEAPKDEHYTKIFLKSVRGEAKDILAGAKPQNRKQLNARSLYGLTPQSVVKRLKDRSLKSWKDFDAYSETMLGIALNVPIRYYDGWIPESLRKKVRDLERIVKGLSFRVSYDGTELGKPTVLESGSAKKFLERFEFSGEHVAAKGYFYAQHGTVRPRELQGLLVRIRHAAVGEYDQSFWGFSPSEASLIQNWVSAEIWADDRLEDAMNIDRRTLREVHPAYVELRGAMHDKLRAVLADARSRLYEAGSAKRRKANLQATRSEMAVLRSELPASVRQRVGSVLSPTGDDPASAAASLLKRYTVVEVYRAVIDVAKDMLSPAQMAEFLRRLSSRLGQR